MFPTPSLVRLALPPFLPKNPKRNRRARSPVKIETLDRRANTTHDSYQYTLDSRSEITLRYVTLRRAQQNGEELSSINIGIAKQGIETEGISS